MRRPRVLQFVIILAAILISTINVGSTTLRSKVVDAETNEPIEGTFVVVVWRRPVLFPCMDSCSAIHDAVETVTDAEGNFTVDISMGLLANDRKITIYKPGYYLPNYAAFPWLFSERDPPPKESQVVRLIKAPSLRADSKGYVSHVRVCGPNESHRFCVPASKVPRYNQLFELVWRILDRPLFSESFPQLPRLHTAIRAGELDAVRSLLNQGADPNEPDQDGRTALMWITAIIYSNRTEKLAWAERHGGPPWLKEEAKKTYSEVSMRSEEIFRVLLAAGANPNAKSKNGDTALMFAIPTRRQLSGGSRYPDLDLIRKQSPDLVKALLANGANPNVQNNDGLTPLMIAAGRGLGKIVEALLAHGANVNLKANFALTAYEVAEGDEVIKALRNARGPK